MSLNSVNSDPVELILDFIHKDYDDSTNSKKVLKTLTSSNSDEHNTPSYLIEAAREILGAIDLDPMSNDLANETVRATTYYTREDEGLSKDWFGNVWLNPPFSLADKAVEKLINSYEEGAVTSAVLLIKSAIETKRYQKLYPYPFCELNKRVNFLPNELLSSVEIFIILISELLNLKSYSLARLVLLQFKLKKFSDAAPFATVMFYFGKSYYTWNKVMSKHGRVHPGNQVFTRLAMRVSLEDLKDLGVVE